MSGMKVNASAFLGDEDQDGYWAEGVKCAVEVELTDTDEVRIGVVLPDEESDVVTLYVSRLTADKIARFLAAASVSELAVVAESTGKMAERAALAGVSPGSTPECDHAWDEAVCVNCGATTDEVFRGVSPGSDTE